MNEETNRIQNGVENITDDARQLLADTADAAGEQVTKARNRLKSALSAAGDAYDTLQRKTVDGAKVADKTIRQNPYQAIGVAFAVGALVGFLFSRKDR